MTKCETSLLSNICNTFAHTLGQSNTYSNTNSDTKRFPEIFTIGWKVICSSFVCVYGLYRFTTVNKHCTQHTVK